MAIRFLNSQSIDGELTVTGNVGINNTSPDYELDVTGDIQYSGTLFNGPRQEYVGSNFISANQAYNGAASGSYFSAGEYQKIVTIIPSGSSQNYQIVGNIYVQSGASTQVIEVNASLRSNTLPDLDWEIYYEESNTGTRFIKPFLWVKETTTAGFIFGIEVLSGISSIFGTVTADLKINSRSSGDKANVLINTVTASEQTTIDTGYTQQEFIQRSTWDEENLGIGTTNPSTLLHVSSTTNPSIRVTGVTSNNSDPAIELLGTNNSFSEGGQMWYDNSLGVVHISSLYNNDAADIQFHTKVAADRSTSNTRMTIAGDGFVGVGTTNPGHLLDVQGTTDPSIRVRSQGTGSSDDALIRLQTGGSTASNYIFFGDNLDADAGWIRYRHSEDSMQFRVNAAERMRIDSTGNVGIGDDNPDGLLSIKGDGAQIIIDDTDATDTPRLRLRESGATSGSIYTDGKELIFDSGTTEKMRIDTDGNLGLGTTTPDLAYSTMGMQIKAGDSAGLRLTDTTGADFEISARSGDVLLYERNGKDVRFGTGGTERMRIKSDGDVGIGTTNPGQALTVGDSTSTGNYILVEGSNSDNTYTVFEGKRKYPKLTLNDTISGGSSFSLWNLGNTLRFGTNVGSAANAAWYTKSGNAANVIFNGNVGIGTTSPASKLEVDGGDIEVDDRDRGLILRSPDSTRYRITVANGGTLTVTAV